MNKTTAFLLIVITVLSFILGTTMQSHAQSKSYASVVPFVVGSDRVGFLDQSTGRIYIYDENVSKCLFVGQIQGLGQSINVVNAGANQ